MEKLQFNLNPSKRGDTKKEKDFEEIVRNRNISSTESLILNRIIRRTDVKYLIQFHMKAGNDLSTHNPHGYSALPRLSENIHRHTIINMQQNILRLVYYKKCCIKMPF